LFGRDLARSSTVSGPDRLEKRLDLIETHPDAVFRTGKNEMTMNSIDQPVSRRNVAVW
jgi:hypothetical protein